MKFINRLKNIGPGALVAAAFIGPGTITVCSSSGASYGYTLLWVILFSTIATIMFQEMAARLGIVTGKGLGENIRERIDHPILKIVIMLIVVLAIFVGNIAYETGNLTGGAMGLSTLLPHVPLRTIALVMGLVAIVLLYSGSYKYIEKFMTALVFIMAFAFIVTMILSKPDLIAVMKGFIPSFYQVDWMSVVGLIGTTVVPYNLFLHSSSAAQRWKNKEDIKDARIDTVLSIGLGGIVSMCIVIVAATNCGGLQIKSGGDLAMALQPVLGNGATVLVSIGLFAAGLTSTITAPLATAYATSGILGISQDMKTKKFQIIWLIVIVSGMIFLAFNHSSPTQLILIAQGANAIILPIMAIFLMICMNDEKLEEYKNGKLNNIMGFIVLGVTILICIRNIMSMMG